MNIYAKVGRGCAHCEIGVSIAWFASAGGSFGLCIGCLLVWWPNKSAAWIEEQMREYRDHIDDRLVRSLRREESLSGEATTEYKRIKQPQTGDRTASA